MAKAVKAESVKTEKFTLYLPLELWNKINDLAHFNRCTVTELFKQIAQDYADKNERALKLFHEAISKAAESPTQATEATN